MTLNRLLLASALAIAGCMGTEPGGGGVNIGSETAPDPPTTEATTTTTTTMATTTTTIPVFTVTGRVVSSGGDPVARALVTIGDQTAVTGPDGWFSFETTTPGPLAVAKPGWSAAELAWEETTSYYEATLEPETIRGLRVSAEAAADDAMFAELLGLAADTAVNALVFDTKEEGGTVLYETAVADASRIGAVDPQYDPVARIEAAHAQGLYTITRIVSFEDGTRAAAVPGEKLAGVWLDPAAPSARAYLLELAGEACGLGFDEIQFDYVRYPSGRTATVSGQLEMSQEERVAVIAGFLAEARELLHPMGCAVSAAVFGIVASVTDDQGLGQRPEEVSAQVDVLSPMIYPSHYSPGWLGFPNPNQHPYDVTADAVADVLPRMAPGSLLRPYLQAFWWTDSQIRDSIQAAEDHGVGWMLWNVRSNFDRSALPADGEVAP